MRSSSARKKEMPPASESSTRMLGGEAQRRQAQGGGARRSAGLREHRVDAQGAQQRALARHVRPGHQQEGACRADRDVVADAARRRQQRVSEAARRHHRLALHDLRHAPAGILEAQRRQRFELAQGGEPAAGVATGAALPALEQAFYAMRIGSVHKD
jgi:hypothetical protein